MTESKRLLLTVAICVVAGVIAEFATRADPAPDSRLPAPAASATPPAQDRNPQPLEPVVPTGSGPLATALVLPGGKQVPISFAHAINAGDRIDYLTELHCCWRVLEIRFRVWDTYTERLLYVQEVQP